jgi:transcriptional regulator with PAS, ATPase and Fis domain
MAHPKSKAKNKSDRFAPFKIRGKKVQISLYVLIPLIFSGISSLGVILTYQLMQTQIPQHNPGVFFYLLAAVFVVTFLFSLFLLRFFFKPLLKFLQKTQKMPILAHTMKQESKITRDLNQINEIFDNVANILGKVEARELFPDIVGSSPIMRNIFAQILKVAPTDATVLISGESGTGKELIAKSIHEHSRRKGGPFIKVNCVAVPEGLMESEFFGHEKGSFTGAVEQRKGKFELADGGTIFLDEIGDMPPATQAKLLRVLQEKEFERVGGTKTIKVDVRLLAATNKNLPEMIRKGSFREDLYFRLNVFPIHLPPLRERKEDIALLADYFLSSLPGTVHSSLSASVLQALIGYHWPGNVRELKNIIEQASILSENGVIETNHLPSQFRNNEAAPMNIGSDISLDEKLNRFEKELIIDALRKTGGVQVKAADLLGINQRSLWHRIKKLQIDISTIKNLQ